MAATGLTIFPVRVSLTLEPGETKEGTITLENNSEEEVTVEMAVEDFIPTAGETGIQFVGRAEGVTTVRDWITLDAPNKFSFGVGEKRTFRYTVTAPDDAEPGGHFGVVFFKALGQNNEGESLKVGTRVGSLFFVTIPGDFLRSGVVHSFWAPVFLTGSPVSFAIDYENTGTVHFEPRGTIEIFNMVGKKVGETRVEGQVVLPTGRRTLRAQWDPQRILLGRYRATLTMRDGDGNALSTDEAVFYAFPVWYGVLFLVGFLFFYLLVRFVRSHVEIRLK